MPQRLIQIVDADPTAALITQRGLQSYFGDRFTVQIAASPNAAWMACAGGNVDLLIVDPSPRSASISSLLRATRTLRPNLPIVVLTAYDTPGLRAKMRSLGVSNYAAKPIELQELLPLITSALSPSPGHNSDDGLPPLGFKSQLASH